MLKNRRKNVSAFFSICSGKFLRTYIRNFDNCLECPGLQAKSVKSKLKNNRCQRNFTSIRSTSCKIWKLNRKFAKQRQDLQNLSLERCFAPGGRLPEALFMIFLLDSKGAKACKSCKSRQELSNEYLVFTYKIWLRYSRERASQSLPKISKKLE